MAAEISAMDGTDREGDLVIRKTVTVPLSQRDGIQAVHGGDGDLVADAHPFGGRREGAWPAWTTGSAGRSTSSPRTDG